MKTTKATRYIREAAQRCINGHIDVDIDRAFGTVAIDCQELGIEGVFMQGDEADTFIAEVDALCKRYPSLDTYTAALALAEPYAECLFN